MAVKVSKSIRIDSNILANKAAIDQDMSAAMGAMANAILKNAAILAPKKSKTMANSGQVTGYGTQRDITFGGPSVARNGKGYDYTRVQENGGYGKVKFQHYTTSGTGPKFLENAAKAIIKQGIQQYLNSPGKKVLKKGFNIYDHVSTPEIYGK